MGRNRPPAVTVTEDPWYPARQKLVKAKRAARRVYDEMVDEAYTEYARDMNALWASQQQPPTC